MKTITEFDHKKATQTINFFAIKEGGEIDKLKVIKLIWLADRYHLRKYGRPISNDYYYAMKLGPVASFAKDLTGFNVLEEAESKYLNEFLASGGKNVVKSEKAVDTDVFSKTDIDALEKVYAEYGKFSAPKLVDYSHIFPEWKKFEKNLNSGISTREIMSYQDFFLNPTGVKEKNIFNEDSEKLKYARKIFEENYEIANCWS